MPMQQIKCPSVCSNRAVIAYASYVLQVIVSALPHVLAIIQHCGFQCHVLIRVIMSCNSKCLATKT